MPGLNATTASELRDHAATIGCTIPLDRAELLLAYMDAMLEENRKVNLTGIRDREAAVMLHALDSLALGAACKDMLVGTSLDLGTGCADELAWIGQQGVE